MILPPIGMAAYAVNASVTTAEAPVKRLAAAMVMDTAVGVLMPPLGAPADGTVSVSVCTVMPLVEPVVAVAPIVRPARVMVKGVPAGIPATAVVITIEVVVLCADVAVMVPTDVLPAVLAAGAAEDAKNPGGKLRVILPPIGRAAEVVNASVTATAAALATRLAAAMVMDTAVGVLMPPLGAPSDTVVSVSVCTVMPVVEPAVAAPMVRPASVMVKGVPAEMGAFEMVITKRLFAVSCEDVAVKYPTDVLPATLPEGAWDAKNEER